MLIRPCGDCQFSSHPPLQGNLFQRWLAKTNGDSLSRDRQNQSEHDEAGFKDTLLKPQKFPCIPLARDLCVVTNHPQSLLSNKTLELEPHIVNDTLF